jgi:alpha-tubulin suppressor-like RCC1 family protein
MLLNKFFDVMVDCSIERALSAVIDSKGCVWVWGENLGGELGVGDFEPKSQPTLVNQLSEKNVEFAACGGNYIVCLGASYTGNRKKSRSKSQQRTGQKENRRLKENKGVSFRAQPNLT